MDYEKKYKEALERAEHLIIDCGDNEGRKKMIHRIFPELRESEDEIIRNRLINLIRELASATVPIMTSGYFIDGQDKRYIAYLEKQKEQKPVERYLDLTELLVPQRNIGQKLVTDDWSIKDANFHSNLLYLMRENNSKEGWEGCYEWLEELPSRISLEQKPAEWSEEDEHRRKDAIYFLESAKRHYAGTSEIEKTIAWLKSLRPSWKPSEEQMRALQNAVALTACDKELARLYNQLKKL